MSETNAYTALGAALRERVAIIADRDFYQRDPEAHLEKLKNVSQKIEELAAALPKPVPGDLAHYIHRASYAKALAWIDEHTATRG
jgi:hypothetical protein